MKFIVYTDLLGQIIICYLYSSRPPQRETIPLWCVAFIKLRYYFIEHIIMGFWKQLILLEMVFTKKMEHLREDFVESHLL